MSLLFEMAGVNVAVEAHSSREDFWAVVAGIFDIMVDVFDVLRKCVAHRERFIASIVFAGELLRDVQVVFLRHVLIHVLLRVQHFMADFASKHQHLNLLVGSSDVFRLSSLSHSFRWLWNVGVLEMIEEDRGAGVFRVLGTQFVLALDAQTAVVVELIDLLVLKILQHSKVFPG